MGSSHRPILPPELQLKVFQSVSDKEMLSRLLAVSRFVNELAAPLLYEDVRLLAIQDSGPGKCKSKFQSDVDSLTASISANGGRLGARVKRLHIRWPFPKDTGGSKWRKILSFCPNLEYLKLSATSLPHILFDSSVFDSLHGSVRLTHLSLNVISSPTAFKSFLESQYALASLSIRTVDAEFSLSPDALPNLVHLSGTWRFLVALIPGRRVAHLVIEDGSAGSAEADHLSLAMTQSLNSIQTLSTWNDEHGSGLGILPKLQNLKYLMIVHLSLEPPNTLLSQLSQLPLTKLRYLQLGVGSLVSQDSNWTFLFKKLPSLRLLDIRHAIHRPNSTWHRYRFDDLDSRPKAVNLDYDIWQQWWHVIQQDVEDASTGEDLRHQVASVSS